MNSNSLPRPNVRTILFLRDKLLYESISFKVILYTTIILFVNNIFLYPGFLYEYLNPNNIEYVLLNPKNILRCVLRYVIYPIVITCDGTANDLLMTWLLLYHMGKRIEFLYKISMKRIFIQSYIILLLTQLVVDLLFKKIYVPRMKYAHVVYTILGDYPTGLSATMVCIFKKYYFKEKYIWSLKINRFFNIKLPSNVFTYSVMIVYLITHHKELFSLIVQYFLFKLIFTR
ncbi:hypothetical protein D499_0L01040 [Hanseniaspora uvarum DSM 2768]|nr:hypothetical protein D499_0L01040 [Hanseniaspora uvarum DSM 2768]